MVLRLMAVSCIAGFMLVGCGGSSDGSTSTNGGTSGSTCSSANCTGCCFNGQCQSGNTAAACGKNGATCSECGSAEVCLTAQTCGVDPESTWMVQPTSASITSTNNGTAWDADGSAPDPYVVLNCPPTATPVDSQTPAVQDSVSPTWTTGGCATKASALLAQPLLFQVFDQDTISDDTITPPLQYQFTEANFNAGTVQASCTPPNCQGGLTTITFTLTKQ